MMCFGGLLMVETRVKSQDCCRCFSLRPRTIQLDGPPRAGAYRQGKPCAIMCPPMSDISNEVDWIEKIIGLGSFDSERCTNAPCARRKPIKPSMLGSQGMQDGMTFWVALKILENTHVMGTSLRLDEIPLPTASHGSEQWSHVAEVAGLLRVKASDGAPWRISIIELYVIQIGKVSNLLFRWLNSTSFSSMTLVDWRQGCWVKIMRMICLLHRKVSTEIECVFWGLLFT